MEFYKIITVAVLIIILLAVASWFLLNAGSFVSDITKPLNKLNPSKMLDNLSPENMMDKSFKQAKQGVDVSKKIIKEGKEPAKKVGKGIAKEGKKLGKLFK